MDTSRQDVPLTGLSARAQTAVQRALAGRPLTRGNLQLLSQRDILKLPGIGRQTLKEIVRWAAAAGVPLPRR